MKQSLQFITLYIVPSFKFVVGNQTSISHIFIVSEHEFHAWCLELKLDFQKKIVRNTEFKKRTLNQTSCQIFESWPDRINSGTSNRGTLK